MEVLGVADEIKRQCLNDLPRLVCNGGELAKLTEKPNVK